MRTDEKGGSGYQCIAGPNFWGKLRFDFHGLEGGAFLDDEVHFQSFAVAPERDGRALAPVIVGFQKKTTGAR
jgi:hypothetical protein